MAVSFRAVANDVSRPEESKRLNGIIGLEHHRVSALRHGRGLPIEGVAIDAFFGKVDMWISVVSIVTQLLIAPVVTMRFGLGTALFVVPAADLLLSAGFLLVPTLAAAAALSVTDSALTHSINPSAKEAHYTPTSRDANFKAKTFIDMFVQRAAKVLAVVLNLAFAALPGIAAVEWLSLASIVVPPRGLRSSASPEAASRAVLVRAPAQRGLKALPFGSWLYAPGRSTSRHAADAPGALGVWLYVSRGVGSYPAPILFFFRSNCALITPMPATGA